MARSKAGRPKGQTPRQAVLLSGIIDGLPQGKAGELAGYASPQATNNALARMADRVRTAMVRVGLTEDYVLSKIKEVTEADRTEAAQYKGEFTDLLVLPDYPVRLKALETAARLLRLFPEREDGDSKSATVAVQIVTNVTLDKP